jgi:hypothetical protein
VLDDEQEAVIAPAEVEVAVPPGMEIARAAESPPVGLSGGILAQVMHDEDGHGVLALEGAELPEQRRDLGGRVLIEAMETDQRIEDQELWAPVVEGAPEAGAVDGVIEAQGGGEDEAEVQSAELEGAGPGEVLEPRLDLLGAVFGGVEEDGTRLRDREAAEGRRGARHTHGEVQGEPGLGGLGRPTDDAHGLGTPELLDEPVGPGGGGGELAHRDHRQRLHAGRYTRGGHFPLRRLAFWAARSRASFRR